MILFSTALSFAIAAHAAPPVLIPIATEQQGLYAQCLSRDGSVVAGAAPGRAQAPNGSVIFRWSLLGTVVLPQSDPPGAFPPNDQAVSLNKDGAIVGGMGGSRQAQGMRWSLAEGFRLAPQLDTGPQQTAVHAMSADGRYIVGHGSTNAGMRPFLADLNGLVSFNMANIGTPVAMFSGDAYAIDSQGNRVLGSYSPAGVGGTVYCLWENGVRNDLSPPAGVSSWVPARISGDGLTLLGECYLNAAPSERRLFRWSNSGGLVLVPQLAGGGHSIVEYVDEHAQSIAGSVTGEGTSSAVLWRGSEPPITVDALCDGYGLARGDLHFAEVRGLSSDGQVLLLIGRHPNGNGEAWMLRLPEAVAFCKADIGAQGAVAAPDGELDNNDFIVFIAYFFTRNARADFGKQGGLQGCDLQLDNNDFVAFIGAFFEGCR